MDAYAEYLWVSVILFVAGFMTGYAGFGAVLLSLPLLTLFMDMKTAIAVAAMAACSITLILVTKLRSHIDLHKVGPLLLGAVPGIPIGVWFLKHLDRSMLQLFLGAILIAYPLFRCTFTAPAREIGKQGACVFGFFAGCLGGTLGASGPPVIIYGSMQPWTKDQIKATLLCFFALETSAVVLIYGLAGMITRTALQHFGVSLALIVAGTTLGSALYRATIDQGYRRLMLILMPLLGLLMIWRGLNLPICSG